MQDAGRRDAADALIGPCPDATCVGEVNQNKPHQSSALYAADITALDAKSGLLLPCAFLSWTLERHRTSFVAVQLCQPKAHQRTRKQCRLPLLPSPCRSRSPVPSLHTSSLSSPQIWSPSSSPRIRRPCTSQLAPVHRMLSSPRPRAHTVFNRRTHRIR